MTRITTLGLLLLVLANNAFAQVGADLSQGYTLKTVPLQFGGAYRAIADTNAAILYNPAGIAQKKGVVSASADYLHSEWTGSTVLSASVVDYKTTDMVALGLAYDRDTPKLGSIDSTVHQLTLAAAAEVSSIVYLGGNLKGYLTKVDSPFGGGPDSVDMDLGLLVKPIPFLSLGLTLQNMIQGGRYEEFPRELGFGVALSLPPHARFSVDIMRNFNTPATGALNAYFGGELRLFEGIFMRGGFGLDRIAQNNFYSLGALLAGPRVGLNFVFSQRLSPSEETLGGNLEFYF